MTLTHRTAGITTLLSLALLALYLTFPTKVYYWDGIVFAQAIEDARVAGASLVHPNHLLYNFAGYSFYQSLRALGLNLRAVAALQILNSVLSVGCAVLLFAILRDALRSLYLSGWLTLLFALSATWWKFSTDANAYIPSVFFLLLSFYLILPDREPRPLMLALSFFAAMCFHQLAVLAYPTLALGVYLQDGAISIKRRFANLFTFSLSAFVLIVATYAFVFYRVTGAFDLKRFWLWTTSYSPDADTHFSLGSNLGYSLRGEVRLFLGGRLNLLQGLMNPAVVLLIVLLVVTVVLLIFVLLRNLPTLSTRFRECLLMPRQKTMLLLALLWSGCYVVFLFFWLPQDTFYRVFYLPALILSLGLAISALSRGKLRRTYATALFVIAVGLANFLFLIFPFSHVEKYPPLAFAVQMQREWPAGTIVYYGKQNSDASLVRYFNPTTHWEQLPSQFSTDFPGRNVWLETTAIDQLAATTETANWLKLHAHPESLRELNNGAFRIRFIKIGP